MRRDDSAWQARAQARYGPYGTGAARLMNAGKERNRAGRMRRDDSCMAGAGTGTVWAVWNGRRPLDERRQREKQGRTDAAGWLCMAGAGTGTVWAVWNRRRPLDERRQREKQGRTDAAGWLCMAGAGTGTVWAVWNRRPPAGGRRPKEWRVPEERGIIGLPGRQAGQSTVCGIWCQKRKRRRYARRFLKKCAHLVASCSRFRYIFVLK